MQATDRRKRRTVMAAIAALPVNGIARVASEDRAGDKNLDQVRAENSKVLVAFFSRSGNTRVVAGLLQRAFSADVFEIRPANFYPDEYLATVEQAKQERDSGFEPPLAKRVPNIGLYDPFYLGFPIWGETAPPVIRSFLADHDLTGTAINPFVTHGGYGLGNSLSVLARYAPRACIGTPFVMQADQERESMNRVNEWLAAQRG